jgi:uncharacterized protein (UPF0210 family)
MRILEFIFKNHIIGAMKIRTITTGINLRARVFPKQVERAAKATQTLKGCFEAAGYEVQTVRIATQPWERYCPKPAQLADLAVRLEEILSRSGIDFFSLGTTWRADYAKYLYDVIYRTKTAFCTVSVGRGSRIDLNCAQASTGLVKKLARINGDGFANLRFAACFNTPPGTPFFPAAYHKGAASFTLGMENSDLVYEAFTEAGDFTRAAGHLQRLLDREFRKVERTAQKAAEKAEISYGGLDVSVAPSVKRHQSVAFACEKLGLGRFGESGTLAVARLITRALKKVPVKQCGYSGLMLPVLEDFGLARRNSEGYFDASHLLAYSAVCGTGLDTIPLPGDVSRRRLYGLLLDIGTLSGTLHKPLSARLMPVPGKKAGEWTTYNFPYFANTRILAL